MLKNHRLLPTALITLFCVACGDDEAEEAKKKAEQLLITVQDDYVDWATAPGYGTRQPAFGPHGDEVSIFVNDILNTAIEGSGIAAWPDGSIVVKEVYTNDELTHLAVMEKESSSWFYVEYQDDGTLLESCSGPCAGRPRVCLGCHQDGDDELLAILFP